MEMTAEYLQRLAKSKDLREVHNSRIIARLNGLQDDITGYILDTLTHAFEVSHIPKDQIKNVTKEISDFMERDDMDLEKKVRVISGILIRQQKFKIGTHITNYYYGEVILEY